MSRPTAGGVRFTRNVGNIVMDLNDVEAIDLNALGGADTVTVNDLSGTDVVNVAADLDAAEATPADNVVVNGPTATTSRSVARRGPVRRCSGCPPSVRSPAPAPATG